MGGQYIEPMFRREHALATALPAAWPRTCGVCGRWCRQAWCHDCLGRFAPLRVRCPGCALPLAVNLSPGLRCGTCLRQPPAWDQAVTVFDYGFPWDRTIAALKYGDQPELARPLADLLASAVRAMGEAPPVEPVDWVLPVPLAPSRLAQRGYNQAWELARHVAGRLGLPARADGLQRLDGEQHQVGASRGQRLQQLRHAFWVQPGQGPALAGAHVALVDDVVTTGATAEAATLALRSAGVASVQLWMLARTPPPD